MGREYKKMIIRDPAQGLLPFSRLAMLPLLPPHILCLWIILGPINPAHKFKHQALQMMYEDHNQRDRRMSKRSSKHKSRYQTTIFIKESFFRGSSKPPCDLLVNQHSMFP